MTGVTGATLDNEELPLCESLLETTVQHLVAILLDGPQEGLGFGCHYHSSLSRINTIDPLIMPCSA